MSREYNGIQEVIVQNFRAKPDTKMRDTPDAELADLAATIAVTRLVLGPEARIQAPPNLVGDEYQLILDAGIDDWGGVSPLTPDHVNPERPWPQIDELAEVTADGGLHAQRAPHDLPAVHPRAVARPDACRRTSPPSPIQRPASRTRPRSRRAGPGTSPPPRFWPAVAGRSPAYAELMSHGATRMGLPSPDKVSEWLAAAAADPASLPDEGYEALLGADGRQLEELCELADSLRRQAVGDALTYVVNRNLDTCGRGRH